MASTQHLISIKLALKDELSKPIANAGNDLAKLGNKLKSVGQTLTNALTLPIIGIGIASAKMAMDLDEAMRNIQSVSKITDAEMKALSQTFVKMSIDADMTTDSALGLAEAFYEIQGSGFAGEKAMKILEVSTKAATAGLTDTKTAAKALTQVLNTYKLSVDQAAFISDIMFETVNRGVGSYEELASSLSHVTGMAAALKVPFHEVAAALATMSRNGIDFNEGSVALNMAMTSLLNPTEEMAKATKALGYASAEAMLDSLGFAETINQLRQYAGDSETKLNAMFGSVRGGRAILALTGENFKSFTEDIKAMNDAGGAAAAAFAIQMESFSAQWKIFMNTLGAAAIEIGNILLPFLADLLENYIIPLVKWFIDLDDSTTGWILALAGLAAVAGPIIGFVGSLYTGLGALVTMFPAIAAGISSIGAAFAFLITPVGLFLLAFAGLAAALIFNWGGIRDAFASGVTFIAEQMYKLPDIIGNVGSMIAQGWENIYHSVGTTLSQIAQIVGITLGRLAVIGLAIGKEIIAGLIKGISSAIIQLIKFVTDKANEISNAIKNAFGIHSPSKVMEGIGKNVVAGFHKGIEAMGGVGVTVPSISSTNRGQPSLSYSGAGASSGATNNFYITSHGTSDEQIKHITKEVSKNLGKQSLQKGAKNIP